MKNTINRIAASLLMIAHISAFAQEVIPQDVLKLGKAANTTTEKRIIFNKGLGATNPEIKWNNTTGSFQSCIAGVCNDLGSGGSGGGAGENFTQFGTAESGIGTWAAYNDGLTNTIPVDCNGGVVDPGWTYVVSADTSLQKLNNFLLTKPASNVQGHGARLPFTIENSARGYKIQASGTMKKASGTYAEAMLPTKADLILYFYDVTNGKLIHPEGDFNINPATGRFTASFQASIDSSSYRMCIHQSTASTQAYAVRFDEVVIGRNPVDLGPVVSDWENFTPTGTWITNTTYTGRFKRIGDTALIQIGWATSGAPTAVSLNLGYSAVCTVDRTKLSTGDNQVFSNSKAVESGGSAHLGQVNLLPSDLVQPVAFSSAFPLVDVAMTDAYPFTWGAGDFGSAEFTIPCTGWSTAFTSAKALPSGRTLAASVYLSGAQNTTNGVLAKVLLDTVEYDTAGMFDLANNRIKIPESGKWDVCGQSSFAVNAVGVRVSGTVTAAGQIAVAGAPGSGTYGIGAPACKNGVPLNAGDYIELTALQDSGSTIALTSDRAYTYLSVKKSVDGAVALGQPKIFASYNSNSSQTINATTATVVDFEDRVIDTHSAVVTGSTWRFVAPRSDIYRACVASTFQATGWTANAQVIYAMEQAGSVSDIKYFGGQVAWTGNTVTLSVAGCTSTRLAAGDTWQPYIENSDASHVLSADPRLVWITIESTSN